MRVLALGSAVPLSVARLAPRVFGHPLGRGLIESARARSAPAEEEPSRTGNVSINRADRRRRHPGSTGLRLGRGRRTDRQKQEAEGGSIKSRGDLRRQSSPGVLSGSIGL
jgi:hypothetical protein